MVKVINATAEHTDLIGCGCPMCTGYVEPVSGHDLAMVGLGDEASVDRLAGSTAANGKAIWTADQAADHLNRTGTDWTGRDVENNAAQSDGNLAEITFGFHESQATLAASGYDYNGPDGYFDEYDNFLAFNATQRDAAREAIGFWDDVVAVSFREVADVSQADIAYGNLASAPGTQAYAYLPYNYGASYNDIAGDVWVSASQPSNFQLKPGGYGLNTLTHETGHAIGLSHPGDYNFGANFSATYANGAEYYQDARNYSIMSYWNARDIGARDFNWNTMSLAYGATPMVHDILAAQNIYGVDTTTRTGNTTYGFNSTAGKDVFDFTVNTAPTVTIWDAGGIDTLDASGYRADQEINLTPGSLSSIGGVTYAEALERLSFEQVNANRAAQGFAATTRATYDANIAALASNNAVGRLTDNFGIAYGATIENAVGGSGNDTIIGNAVDNILTGGAGNDRLSGNDGNDMLIGGLGSDTLDGGTGFDTASYRDAAAGVAISLLSGTGTAGEAMGDVFVSIERIEGSAFGDTLIGGNAADQLVGLAGNDSLDGGAGTDWLDGGLGNDTLLGGSGADTLFGGLGDDRLDGGNDADSIDGGDGRDTLLGGSGADVLLGGLGDDSLDGGTDADRLEGGDGNDILLGGTGRDALLGGEGADTLDGGIDDDTLDGGAGADRLEGGNGRDTLFGGTGDDVLSGGNDDDRLNGGAGADTLTGGLGKDVFVFTDLGSIDTVTDFRRGEDKIDLSGFDAKSNVEGMQAFTFIGSSAFSNVAGQLHTYMEGRNMFVSGDVDGNGLADFTIALGTNTVTAADFIFA